VPLNGRRKAKILLQIKFDIKNPFRISKNKDGVKSIVQEVTPLHLIFKRKHLENNKNIIAIQPIYLIVSAFLFAAQNAKKFNE
jgi:hypothetical protein